MKIYVVTDRDCNVPLVTFDQNLARQDLKGRHCHTKTLNLSLDFLEATLNAKRLETEMFEQRNKEKLIGLSDLLGCSHATALEILREFGNADSEIHKPDESEQVRGES